MANNEFDRTVINVRERPVSSDINQAQSTLDRTIRFLVDQMHVPRAAIGDPSAGTPVNGVIGNAFRVTENNPADLSVNVVTGVAFKNDPGDTPTAIGGVPNVDDLGRYKPILLRAIANIAVPSESLPNSRIDIVEININRRLADPASRDVLNPGTGVFDPTSVNKTLAWDIGASIGEVATPANSTAALSLKTGVASTTPAIPPTSPGYTKIAEIIVAGGATQLFQNNINDLRNILAIHNIRSVVAKGTFSGGVVTMDSLFAPPGVEAAFNDLAGRKLYIKAGNVLGALPVATVSQAAATASGVAAVVVNTDTTLRTSLNTPAESDPLIQVVDDYPALALSGQKLIEVDILPAADGTFTVRVEW